VTVGGRNVVLDAEGISCPAAAAAFGFRLLPAQLRSGKHLEFLNEKAIPASRSKRALAALEQREKSAPGR
jgi:uncharacterized protein (DUF169 family)